jgi:hypothetical protein
MHHVSMKLDPLIAALACTAVCLAAAPAQALSAMTLTWTDATCGVSGGPAFDCSDSLRVADASQQSVFVRATLHYEYRDDGLPLEGNWSFPSVVPWPLVQETHEVGALYFTSNACADYFDCMRRPLSEWGSFNMSADPQVLGRNAVPDSLSGDFTLLATGNGSAWISAMGVTFDARGTNVFTPVTAPIPEPSTWALMAAGLLSIGALARRRSHGPVCLAL